MSKENKVEQPNNVQNMEKGTMLNNIFYNSMCKEVSCDAVIPYTKEKAFDKLEKKFVEAINNGNLYENCLDVVLENGKITKEINQTRAS